VTPWNRIDRYAFIFFIGIFFLSLIFAQPRRYIWFEDLATAHESFSGTPPPQALESVEQRAAANALRQAGLITIEPKLNPQGILQIHSSEGENTTTFKECIRKGVNSIEGDNQEFVVTLSQSILAIEEFNRPYWMRTLKDSLAWGSLHVFGRVVPMSLGIGQVRLKRFRSLLGSGWHLGDTENPSDPASELAILLDPCTNAAVVGGIVQQEYGQDPNATIEQLARRYNGGSNVRGVFNYTNMVKRVFEILESATPAGEATAPEETSSQTQDQGATPQSESAPTDNQSPKGEEPTSANGSGWKIQVVFQRCDSSKPTLKSCSSHAFLFDAKTGDVYSCNGTMISFSATSPAPPTVTVRCDKASSPISGPIEFAAPNPSVYRPGQTHNKNNTRFEEFTNYYWVVGATIDELRFCYLPSNVCSDAPSIN
jgi:hypothetical protein